jgi:hypothetical protein
MDERRNESTPSERIAEWLMEPLASFGERDATILLLAVGLMLSYFPTYAYIHDWSAWLFYFGGMICCLKVIASALSIVQKLLNSLFFRSVVRTVVLAACAVGGHSAGVQIDMSSGDGNGWIFKLMALFFVILALPNIFICLKYFYDLQDKKKFLAEAFTLKNIATFLSATVAFLTILLPFIQEVLSLIWSKH